MDRLNSTNLVTTKAGLTGISGGATTFSTGAAAQSYSIGGKAYSKAQVSGGTTPTTDAVSGSAITLIANQGLVALWCLDASGNVKVAAGGVQSLDNAGNFLIPPAFPALPDTLVPFAYHVVKGGSTTSGTWTFGSSNWNSTGLSHSVVDIMTLPDRPQTA